MMIRISAFVLALWVSVGMASAALTSIQIHSGTTLNSLGSFDGGIDYDGVSQLTITLTNTSPAANGGFLTGLVFNINGDATAALNPNPTGAFLDLVGGDTASPYGIYEAGAALGGDWEGGGSPLLGVPVGGTQAFVFNVTGPDAASLTASDFFSENGTHPPGNLDSVFVARFRGFVNGGSDKAPGEPGPGPGPGPGIPVPAAAWTGGAMLALLGATRKSVLRALQM